MYYFDSKSDLKFLHEFKNIVSLFYASRNFLLSFSQCLRPLPEEIEQIKEAEEMNKIARESVARMLKKANRISSKCGVSTDVISFPPPLLGGYSIPVNIYSAILNDNSHGKKIGEKLVLDTINQAIGQATTNVKNDFWHIVNPIFWFKILVIKAIRIPYWILQASGFNIDKVEVKAFAKILKMIGIILILGGLSYLGISKLELKKILVDKFMSIEPYLKYLLRLSDWEK